MVHAATESVAVALPRWLTPYASGEKQGWSQAVIAYAEYYGVE